MHDTMMSCERTGENKSTELLVDHIEREQISFCHQLVSWDNHLQHSPVSLEWCCCESFLDRKWKTVMKLYSTTIPKLMFFKIWLIWHANETSESSQRCAQLLRSGLLSKQVITAIWPFVLNLHDYMTWFSSVQQNLVAYV